MPLEREVTFSASASMSEPLLAGALIADLIS